MNRTIRRTSVLVAALGVVAVAATAPHATADARPARAATAPATRHTVALAAGSSPIKHVVVIFQENHSFDNVLGVLCVQDHRCDGSTTGKLLDGSTVPLSKATDIIPNVAHSTAGQQQAIDNGKMDGWQSISGCSKTVGLRCLSQYSPDQIPNLSALARQYAISDRTFELDRILSFGAHVELASADLDGFAGNIPSRPKYAKQAGPGWGCDSYKVTPWRPGASGPYQDVPPCIPNTDGTGSWWDKYGPAGIPQLSPVKHVTNIFDNLDAAGRTWKVYNKFPAFDVCSYFATCAHSVQHNNVVASSSVITDAQKGALPDLSLVLPDQNKQVGDMSQHNQASMAVGDNWIGNVVRSIQNGPDWPSTAVFITYDDCGCFYDHVPPPTSRLGVRLPMVIVSPYVRHGYTDSTNVSFVGMLAFTETNFGLPTMSADDAASYNYMGTFDFTSPPDLTRTPLVTTQVPKSVLDKVKKVTLDPDDPDDAT